jgi:hypothetical protein
MNNEIEASPRDAPYEITNEVYASDVVKTLYKLLS